MNSGKNKCNLSFLFPNVNKEKKNKKFIKNKKREKERSQIQYSITQKSVLFHPVFVNSKQDTSVFIQKMFDFFFLNSQWKSCFFSEAICFENTSLIKKKSFLNSL